MTSDDSCSPLGAERAWRLLVPRLRSPLRPGADFGGHSIWLRYTWPRRPPSALVEVTDAVLPPTDRQLDALAGFLAELERQLRDADPGDDRRRLPARFSLLRTRPGGGAPSTADLAWAEAFSAAGEATGLTCVLACLATRDGFRRLPQGTRRRSA